MKKLSKACLSIVFAVALVPFPLIISHINNLNNKDINANEDIYDDTVPFVITSLYDTEYNNSGGSIKLIATDSNSRGDISTNGEWLMESSSNVFSITSKNYLYWIISLDVNDRDTPYTTDIRFNVEYSNNQQYSVVQTISLNIMPNTHKLPIITENYNGYTNSLYGGQTPLISNIVGGTWDGDSTDQLTIVNGNVIWKNDTPAGLYKINVRYLAKNYATVSQIINLTLMQANVNSTNWIGKISGDLKWTIDQNYVTYYYSSNFIATNLILPSMVWQGNKNYQVKIDDFVFSQTKIVGDLIISDGITSIGNYSFADCNGLTSIVLGEGLLSIGSHTFNGCSSAEGSLILPSTLTTIGNGAFKNCKSFNSVFIPKGLHIIPMESFANCTNINSINLDKRDNKISVLNNSFNSFSDIGNIVANGVWNDKQEILTEFAEGNLPSSWLVNGI